MYCHVIFTEVTRGKFFKNFFPLRKVIAVFVPRLSDLRCVCYHPIYIEVIGVVFFNQLFSPRKLCFVCTSGLRFVYFHISFQLFFPPLVKVTVVFVCKLSGMRLVYYRAIFTKSYPGYDFQQNNSLDHSYRGVCI